MPFNPIEIFWHLIGPLHFMLIAATYIPTTILSLLSSSQYATLLSPTRFKETWFANFWTVVGPQTRLEATPRVEPLISQAHGVVLDIGPGSGEWLSLFDKKKVKKIVGRRLLASEQFPPKVFLRMEGSALPVNEDPWVDGKASTDFAAFSLPQLIIKKTRQQQPGRFRAVLVEAESVICSHSYVSVHGPSPSWRVRRWSIAVC